MTELLGEKSFPPEKKVKKFDVGLAVCQFDFDLVIIQQEGGFRVIIRCDGPFVGRVFVKIVGCLTV